MTVTLVRSDRPDCGSDCPEWLALTGKIGPETPGLLATALAQLGARHVPVLVDSPGGAVQAAIVMGKRIRARALDVAVAGTTLTDCRPGDHVCVTQRHKGERPGYVAAGVAACASACVLLLAAGTDRSVARGSFVGVHQMVSRRVFRRVINTFRVFRRMVGGRTVEVSRTLIATRPVSSHVEQSEAPESVYSEVDRYLLAMGIKNSIMSLMRSTPSTGIHWMTAPELVGTGIAIDTTEASTLVLRAAMRASADWPFSSFIEPASFAVGDDHPHEGTVAWRVDHVSTSPTLVGDVDIPDRHLHGTLSVSRFTAPTAAASFLIEASFAVPPGTGVSAVSTIGQPKLCDASNCDTRAVSGSVMRNDAAGYGFEVTLARGDDFLSALRTRSLMALPVAMGDDAAGTIGLTIAGGGRKAIEEWEAACCGLASPSRHP